MHRFGSRTLADSGVKAPAKALTFGQFLLNLVPSSAVGAFADGEVIPVLCFSLMVAFASACLGDQREKPLLDEPFKWVTQRFYLR